MQDTAYTDGCTSDSECSMLLLSVCCLPLPQEDQEELAAVEQEARGELRAAQQALAEAQEALALTADKVGCG